VESTAVYNLPLMSISHYLRCNLYGKYVQRDYLVPMMGWNFDKVFSITDEARMLHCARIAMGLNALVAVTHLALPIRWFLMVWLDVFIFAMYTLYVLMVVGVAANAILIRFGILTLSLIVGSAIGLRS